MGYTDMTAGFYNLPVFSILNGAVEQSASKTPIVPDPRDRNCSEKKLQMNAAGLTETACNIVFCLLVGGIGKEAAGQVILDQFT